MYLIGLTGGIAAGKSTVAQRWAELGGIEIDADQLARDVVAPGTVGAAKVRETFGDSVFDGEILNRPKLGEIVFANAEKREQLEQILHPLVRELALSKVTQLPASSMVIYNVPLLVEAKVDLPFDQVVTVEAPLEEQVKRMVACRGLTAEQALARIRAQATPAQRANRADFILNSNQSLDLLLKDAGALWFKFQQLADRKHSESKEANRG